MLVVYFIFLFTFLGCPIVALIFYRTSSMKTVAPVIKWLIAFFIVHAIFFSVGFSFMGDLTDYCVFCAEYFVGCHLVSLLYRSSKPVAIFLRTIATGLIAAGFGIGFFGIFLFPVLAQDYAPRRIFSFESGRHSYVSREYTYWFVASMEYKHTFETYRHYAPLPFERKIDVTVFVESASTLNFRTEGFSIGLVNHGHDEYLQFTSGNGATFSILIR